MSITATDAPGLSTPPAPTSHQSWWDAVLRHVHHDDVTTIAAAVLAALVTVLLARRTYVQQREQSRQQERATLYAEALRAVEDYIECPYRVLRRDGTAQARRDITEKVSDVKSRISFYRGWMDINGSPSVAAAYSAYEAAARREAGGQMKTAWLQSPTTRDRQVSIGVALPRTESEPYRLALLATMKQDLTSAGRRPWWRHR